MVPRYLTRSTIPCWPTPLASSKLRTRKDLIGLSWAYRFEIKAGFGLPLTCASAYCQYDLLGETFTTETVQPDPPSPSPVLKYSFVHRVDKVRGVYEHGAQWLL